MELDRVAATASVSATTATLVRIVAISVRLMLVVYAMGTVQHVRDVIVSRIPVPFLMNAVCVEVTTAYVPVAMEYPTAGLYWIVVESAMEMDRLVNLNFNVTKDSIARLATLNSVTGVIQHSCAILSPIRLLLAKDHL